MSSLKDALETISDEKLEAGLEKTAATIQQLTLTLLVVSVVAVSVAGTPDLALLLPDSAISMPTFGGMPLRLALVVGPIVLVAVRVYLQRYIVRWRRLESTARQRNLSRPVTISPMRDDILRIGTMSMRYLLVPVAMAVITWKALGDPMPLGYALAMATLFVTVVHLIQDLPAKWFVWVPALVLVGTGVFVLSEPGQRFLPEALAEPLPSTADIHRPLDLRYADLARRVLIEEDLRGADLELANLDQSKLERANLTRANLREASLQNANLWYANLTEVDLQLANLTDADLGVVNLTDADLRAANLTGANLVGANFTNAELSPTNFREARLWHASLSSAHLSGANLSDAELQAANLAYAGLWSATLTAGTLGKSLLFGTSFNYSFATGSTWPGDATNRLAVVDGVCFAPLTLAQNDNGERIIRCGEEGRIFFGDPALLALNLDNAQLGDVLVAAKDLPDTFTDYACVQGDELPIGPDGLPMTDVKSCAHPDFRERMRWFYCGFMHVDGVGELDVPDAYRTDPNPLVITTATCADVGLGTDREREWLEATFPDFDWDDVPR
ncbi:MAG: pentapeptide repeat-containing protein [Pseudomonadota bacterium]